MYINSEITEKVIKDNDCKYWYFIIECNINKE